MELSISIPQSPLVEEAKKVEGAGKAELQRKQEQERIAEAEDAIAKMKMLSCKHCIEKDEEYGSCEILDIKRHFRGAGSWRWMWLRFCKDCREWEAKDGQRQKEEGSRSSGERASRLAANVHGKSLI